MRLVYRSELGEGLVPVEVGLVADAGVSWNGGIRRGGCPAFLPGSIWAPELVVQVLKSIGVPSAHKNSLPW